MSPSPMWRKFRPESRSSSPARARIDQRVSHSENAPATRPLRPSNDSVRHDGAIVGEYKGIYVWGWRIVNPMDGMRGQVDPQYNVEIGTAGATNDQFVGCRN